MFENTVSVMFVLYTQLMKDAVVRAEIFLFQILDHSSITKKSKKSRVFNHTKMTNVVFGSSENANICNHTYCMYFVS